MVLGWPSFKIVSGDPDFQPRWPGTHPGTIPARFGLIWFSGFRGEDLNVIFYQNMSNLHNLYISAERKIETTGPIATKLWWNGPWMALFQNCVR
jgi:hypothetical protein